MYVGVMMDSPGEGSRARHDQAQPIGLAVVGAAIRETMASGVAIMLPD
jgi:hypothetical protein